MNKVLVLLIAALFMLAACSSDDDETTASLSVTGASGDPVALNGSWSEGCVANDDMGGFEEGVKTLSGSSLSFAQESYLTGTDCTGDSDMTWAAQGSIVLGADVAATMEPSGTAVTATATDITLASFTITPHTEEGAIGLAIMFSFFGADSSGVAVDTASNVLTLFFPVTPELNIIYIDDSVTPNRYFEGISPDEGGTVDANLYPNTIDESWYEVRQ